MNDSNVSGRRRSKRAEEINTKVPSYGGTRLGDTNESHAGRWLRRLLGLLLILGALALALYFVAEPVAELIDRPLASVMVEGDFRYISKERAMELISAEINEDFLQLDLMRMKTALESEPWIEHAALARRWPDALEVRITEQQPIARWGTEGFLNQRGELVRVGNIDALEDLPLLQGNAADAGKIMQQYQDLSQLLRSRGLEVIELKCDNKKSWRLMLKGNVEVAIGRDQVMEKMRRFITVYDQHLNEVWQDVIAIDVRYTNGVAVQWSADSEAKKNYIKSM
ncbi:cell division protein FtsQ/DivIB [Cellvibrio sp. ARAG 10.3]|uniref:cell division protein FtsQ/DivIB n=1 Tax=Cellvibrio sp. ARAG 10.3 TaxID=3451358 RepID=UPI003F477CD8